MGDFHVPFSLLTMKLFDWRCLLEDRHITIKALEDVFLAISEVNAISQILSVLIIDFQDRYFYL